MRTVSKSKPAIKISAKSETKNFLARKRQNCALQYLGQTSFDLKEIAELRTVSKSKQIGRAHV